VSPDLSDRATYADGFPHRHFAWLRANRPIFWHEPTPATPDGEGFWVLARHEDAMAVLLDPASFSSETGGSRSGGGTGLADIPNPRKFMIMSDDPRHKRLRALVNKGFTNRAVHALEAELRRRVVGMIEAFPEGEPFDFVSRFARDLPLQAISLVLGVPEMDRARLAEWVDRSIAAESPQIMAGHWTRKIMGYATGLIEEKRRNPRHDILSTIAHARLEAGEAGAEGGPLSQEELESFFVLLFAAGAETTRSAIGGGLRALIERPEQLERLRGADAGLMRTAIDELLRWTTPTIYKRRTATRDITFKGHAFKAGDKVTFWEASANRDEAMFERPFELDIARSPNRHIAFGFGAHVCLGASLARLEMRIAFEELLARIAHFEQAGPVEWMPSLRLVGVRRMPLAVRFREARPAADRDQAR
jgi:cytochrome P450